MGNLVQLDTSAFTRILEKIDALGGNVHEITERVLREYGVRVTRATFKAAQAPNLPRGGAYSRGYTLESVINHVKVYWEGETAYAPIGFDFSEPGAGGFLIAGTPRMAPDQELRKIYKQKKFMSQVQRDMQDAAWAEMIKLYEKS